jgi:hypothetical protein
MIPAFGMVILPQNLSTGMYRLGRFQAAVGFLAWLAGGIVLE